MSKRAGFNFKLTSPIRTHRIGIRTACSCPMHTVCLICRGVSGSVRECPSCLATCQCDDGCRRARVPWNAETCSRRRCFQFLWFVLHGHPSTFEGGGPAFTREPPQLASIGFLLCDLGIYGPDLIALTNSLRGLDLDATRLHRLRHFALQFDLEQAVFKGSALPLDIVGKVEKRRSNERPAMPR